MPEADLAVPTRSTVSLRPPVERCPVALGPVPDPAEGRARIAAAGTALLHERRLLGAAELAGLAVVPDECVTALAALAHEVRLAWCGPEVEVEGILSAKTGGCPEDCHFCAQSSRFDTPVKATPFLDTDEVLRAAAETAALGASEFCIVMAVRGPDERTMGRILELVPLVRERTGLNVAVSAGILTDDQAGRLAAGGVHRYNHNVETARSFFGRVVTTHSWDERADTCRLVRAHNMELCCGALVGMGESDAQRVELMLQLQELEPTEVPLNFLNPRPGTPLGDRPVVEAWDAIRWIALFRVALPGVILRYAGGREVTLRDLQALGMTAGINALIVGNYLTTLGRSPEEDLRMLEDLRMPIGALSGAICERQAAMARVLITGCSSGFGRATAVELTKRGHQVVATARRPDTLADLDVTTRLALDVTDDDSVAAAVAAAGDIDALVNNAGASVSGPVEAVPIAEVTRIFETNVFGALRMIQAVVPRMRARGTGVVVNVSSVSGKVAQPLAGFYSATKHALEAMSEALYFEVGHFGVRTVIIEPGYFRTSLGDNRREYGVDGPPYDELRDITMALADKVGRANAPGPEAVATAIADAIEKPDTPFRVPVGSDAEMVLATRAQLDDAAFEATMRSMLDADW